MLTIEILHEEVEELSASVQEQIIQCLQKAAELEEVNGEVVITMVTDERIHELNRDYRGVDRPTDVLSFALNEGGEEEPDIFLDEEELEEYPNMLGDIIISVSKAVSQANDYGHSFEREICFLAVHGFLHLLGYDHGTEEEEKAMFSRQEEVLQAIGLTR